MNIFRQSFYNGPFKLVALVFIAGVALGGYFFPLVGLAVPGLIILALATNLGSRRFFCGKLCPNGRLYSAVMQKASRRGALPSWSYSPHVRRAICGFTLFCAVNLLVRYGGGGIAQAARVFWAIYLASIGFGFVMGYFFKPRSWCAVCPMGTLQDTVSFGPGTKNRGAPRPSS